MRILVADKSTTNLTNLSADLAKLGHEVIPAASGQQVIEQFTYHKPDLIIMDVAVESETSFEVTKKIRKMSVDDNWLPIIFLSASIDDERIDKAMDAGGDDYIVEPFSLITLAAKIKVIQRITNLRNTLLSATKKLYLFSSTDMLTGAYNRFQFTRILSEVLLDAERYEYKTALLYVDLDNFKIINDVYGFEIADLILVEVNKRLKLCLRENDYIARLEGDAFAIILNEIENEKDVLVVTDKIIHSIAREYHLREHLIRCTASIGIALYPNELNDIDNILLNAEIAMYHVKKSGRNNFKIFTNELNEKQAHYIKLAEAVKFAQDNKELFLTYQPIFQLKNEKITGVKATICWHHPQYGVISPNVFIPIAEEIGLLPSINLWLLKQVCIDSMDWPFDKLTDFKFSIPISFNQFSDNHFIQELSDIVKYTQISTKRLEIELTESNIMSYEPALISEAMQILDNMGINISIKMFGTSYSSLIRLKQLAINSLQIQNTFIEDAITNQTSDAIISAIILIGQHLQLNVIAEGIETDEQLAYLIAKECPQGLGSLLCQPLKSEAIKEYLENNVLLKT